MSSFPQVADPVASMLGNQIEEGIKAIVEANVVLLANDDAATGVREIDKNLKEYKGEDADILKAVEDLNKKREAFKKAQEKARNLYRVNVLHEDEVSESENDVDTDAVKAKRKLVMEAVTLLSSYAESNGLPEVLEWAKTLSVPQVGRAGSSTVGQKKPRAYVTVNGTTHNSFGEAAKALSVLLSSDDNKVEVTSPELVTAWVEAGEKDSFEFNGYTVTVAEKESKAKAAA